MYTEDDKFESMEAIPDNNGVVWYYGTTTNGTKIFISEDDFFRNCYTLKETLEKEGKIQTFRNICERFKNSDLLLLSGFYGIKRGNN